MMKRFSRRRRSGGDKSKGANGATEWLPKLVEAGIVDTTSLEAWTECGIPSTIATIGRGTRGDGTDVIVAFSARSGSEALLAGLSATAMASEKKPFTGALLLVAPYAQENTDIRVEGELASSPYIDMTLDIMRRFGVDVVNDDG